MLNLKYVSGYENEGNAVAGLYKSIMVEKGSIRDIKEYDYSLYLGNDFGTLFSSDSCKDFAIGDQKIEICFQKSKGELLIFPIEKRDSAVVMNIGIWLQTLDISQSELRKYNAETLSIKTGNSLMDVKLYFNDINFGVDSPKFKNMSFDADLMIKIK